MTDRTMRVIEYAPPYVQYRSGSVDPVVLHDPEPKMIPVRYDHVGGGYLVACLGDGEEMDAAPGVVLLVEETAALENGHDWTRQITRVANDYAADGGAPVLRTERNFRRERHLGTAHDGRLPDYWRNELIVALATHRVVIGDECEELEVEIERGEFGEFSRMLWHAWKFLTTAKLSLSASYDPADWRL